MWTPEEAWNVHRQQGGAPVRRAATGLAARSRMRAVRRALRVLRCCVTAPRSGRCPAMHLLAQGALSDAVHEAPVSLRLQAARPMSKTASFRRRMTYVCRAAAAPPGSIARTGVAPRRTEQFSPPPAAMMRFAAIQSYCRSCLRRRSRLWSWRRSGRRTQRACAAFRTSRWQAAPRSATATARWAVP